MKQISFAKPTGDGNAPSPRHPDRAFESLLQLDAARRTARTSDSRASQGPVPITGRSRELLARVQELCSCEPKYSVAECIERDMTYSAPLKATLQLSLSSRPPSRQEAEEHHREGSLSRRAPLLTPLGTFVNQRRGASHCHASSTAPRASFSRSPHTRTASASSRRASFRSAARGRVHRRHPRCRVVHIDKKKKFPATALLRAFGYGTNSQILRLFFRVVSSISSKKRESRVDPARSARPRSSPRTSRSPVPPTTRRSEASRPRRQDWRWSRERVRAGGQGR